MKKKGVLLFVKILSVILAAFVLYTASFALFPYFVKKDVSEDFQREVAGYDFYGDAPCADRVALVEDPIMSLGTRIRLISEAEKTIDIAYYAMHMGETTDYFLASILEAAERGVKVRLLLDGMSHGFKDDYIYLANALGSHENIEIRLYNPINLLKPWTLNGRMHDKYIIIDNTFLLLGGRNIGDKYFGPDGYDKNLSIDRDVLVYNTKYDTDSRESVLFEVRKYMDNVWSRGNAEKSFNRQSEKSEAEKERLLSLMASFRRESPEFFSTPVNIEAKTFPANKVTFFANDINIYKKEPKVGYIIEELIMGAEEKVLLQSPYVVLSENIENSLSAIGESGLKYEILTNSMQSSPNLPAYSLYLSDKEKIIGTGATIYEFQHKNAIHAKTYIIDERMAVIGSFNLDPRSEYIDTEIMLAVDSEEFTQYLLDIVELYKDNSLVVGENGEYIPDPKVSEYPVSDGKRKLFEIFGKIISPFRVLV